MDARVFSSTDRPRLRTNRRARRRFLLVLLVVIGLVRVLGYLWYDREPYRTDTDLTQDYVSAKAWRDGRDPYAPKGELYDRYLPVESQFLYPPEPNERNPHPTPFILFLSPLSFISLRAARIVLLLTMTAATFVGIYLFCVTVGLARRRAALWALIALATPLVELDVRWAQVNGLLLLAFILAWRDLERNRDTRAGILLGITAALKLFPIFLVIPLIRRRRVRALVSTAITVIAVFAVGAIAFGSQATFSAFRRASQGNYETWAAAPQSISLTSLPVRVISPQRWLHPTREIPTYAIGLGLVLAAMCLYAAVRSSASVTRDVYWAAVPWMIFASPLAWPHYLVLAIPVCILMLTKEQLSPGLRKWTLICTGVLAVLPNLPDYISWFTIPKYATVGVGMTVVLAALVTLALIDFSEPDRRRMGRAQVKKSEMVVGSAPS